MKKSLVYSIGDGAGYCFRLCFRGSRSAQLPQAWLITQKQLSLRSLLRQVSPLLSEPLELVQRYGAGLKRRKRTQLAEILKPRVKFFTMMQGLAMIEFWRFTCWLLR